MVLVSVLVVTYNAGEHLARCLAALARQTFGDFEAIVIDNASTDGAFAQARGTCADPRFVFLANPVNLGFAAANNLAAGRARGAWLALLNPDAFPEPEWLARLIAATGRHSGCDLFGSTQLAATRPGFVDGAGDAYFAPGLPWRALYGAPESALPAADAEVFGACAAACLVRAATFHALGGFDARFFCYCEDVDFAFRLRLAGGRSVQIRDAVVRHVGGASAPGDFARFHGTRNLVWTFWKNMPLPLLLALAPAHALVLAGLALRAAARGRPGPTLRALAAGLGGLPRILRSRSRRTASLASIARALTWNPGLYARRAAAGTPVPPP